MGKRVSGVQARLCMSRGWPRGMQATEDTAAAASYRCCPRLPSERAAACKLLSRGGVRATRGMHEVARPPTQTTVERVVRAGSHVKTRYWLLACFYSWG